MDWHPWLSMSSLDPALVNEYALVFARNELEADDVVYFDHEFLQSMGVSVAKHRLEILKIARKSRTSPRPLARLLAAMDRTRRFVAQYVRSFVHREESSAIIVVPRPSYDGGSSKRAKMLKRIKKSAATPRPTRRMMITGGGAAVHALKDVEKGSAGGRFAESGTEEMMIRWDCMFQDLNPN